MRKINQLVLILILGLVVACKKDDVKPEDPIDIHEEELITSVRLTMIDQDSLQPTVVANFKDLDGPGGNAPSVFDTIRLVANTTYLVNIEFLNESTNPIVNLTSEILSEASEHLICYIPSNVNLNIIRTDSDGTYEIGLNSKWTVGLASTGITTISLKHQPGVKNGLCDLGETDVESNFQTIIQ